MSSKQVSPFLRAWYRWKALRLPWRRQFLVGLDLHGNTYWEFRDVRGWSEFARWRRIVRYAQKTHYADVSVSPAWHQWLRHTREHPPSLDEQQGDVLRQERMKVLAAQADARWAAKPSLTDSPVAASSNHPSLLGSQATGASHDETKPAPEQENSRSGTAEESLTPEEQREETWRKMQQQQQTKPSSQNPWEQRRGGPSEEWQPKAWQPSPSSKRS